MKLIALVEVHPLSGEPSFITARFSSGSGDFDMPLTTEQAELVLRNSPPTVEPDLEDPNSKFYDTLEEPESEEYVEYEPSPISQPAFEEDALVIGQSPSVSIKDFDDDEL